MFWCTDPHSRLLQFMYLLVSIINAQLIWWPKLLWDIHYSSRFVKSVLPSPKWDRVCLFAFCLPLCRLCGVSHLSFRLLIFFIKPLFVFHCFVLGPKKNVNTVCLRCKVNFVKGRYAIVTSGFLKMFCELSLCYEPFQ